MIDFFIGDVIVTNSIHQSHSRSFASIPLTPAGRKQQTKGSVKQNKKKNSNDKILFFFLSGAEG